ncbi:tetratricopeptide repeat protein [Fulvivirga lutea]|uniref:histidine kinase n=1 Tax=Fulvivirga lutea TaxID=2810512 RepID=A0A975A079_9BACT|nr:tetratricopeptide repeat protein [Fulvivirga lutea]QSE96966.1 tetratricopeptide repeat protein [Fulvivirga lutea]
MRKLGLFLFIVFTFSIHSNGQNEQLKQKIDSLNQRTINLWLNYPDSAINYAYEAYRLSKLTDDQELICISLRLIGGAYYYLGDYDSVIVYNDKALKIAKEIENQELVNNALNNLGLANYSLGSYQNALEYLLRSLSLKRAIGQEYGLGTTLNNIGLVYERLKDYKKARAYFLEALEVAESQNDKDLILYSQNNTANTYLRENNLPRAEHYFQLSLAVDVDNKYWKSVTYAGLGQIYQRKSDYEKANGYLSKSAELRSTIGDKRGISEILYLQSKQALYKHNYDSAIELLNQSQSIAIEIGAKDRMFDNLEQYVEIYSEINDKSKAFEYQTKLLQLRDTLFNENLARNLASIQLEIQDEENQQLLAKKDKQLTANKRFVMVLIAVIILIVLLVVVVYNQLRINRKKNATLKIRNIEISVQNEEIEAQKESLEEKNSALERAQALIKAQNEKLEEYNKRLKSSVEEKSDLLKEKNDQLMLANIELDNFIYKSSHDIKGPLATLLGMCHVALLDIKEKKASEYFQKLYSSALDLNAILTRLKTISEISNLELNLDEIHIKKIISECIKQNKKIEGDESINVKLDIKLDKPMVSDSALMDLIFFNLIQSILKMRGDTNLEKAIDILIDSDDSNIIIDVVDEGSASVKSELGDVFELFKKSALQHRTLGLGLYIVKQSILKLGGNIALLDDKNHTHFKITLPLT